MCITKGVSKQMWVGTYIQCYTCSEQEEDDFLERVSFLYASGTRGLGQHTQERHDPAMQCSDTGLLSMAVYLHQVSTQKLNAGKKNVITIESYNHTITPLPSPHPPPPARKPALLPQVCT